MQADCALRDWLSDLMSYPGRRPGGHVEFGLCVCVNVEMAWFSVCADGLSVGGLFICLAATNNMQGHCWIADCIWNTSSACLVCILIPNAGQAGEVILICFYFEWQWKEQCRLHALVEFSVQSSQVKSYKRTSISVLIATFWAFFLPFYHFNGKISFNSHG